jgi:hypothetical protein
MKATDASLTARTEPAGAARITDIGRAAGGEVARSGGVRPGRWRSTKGRTPERSTISGCGEAARRNCGRVDAAVVEAAVADKDQRNGA